MSASSSTQQTRIKKRIKHSYLSVNEKNMVLNVYKNELQRNREKSIGEVISITANITGVSKRTIYRIRKELSVGGALCSPKKTKHRLKITEKVDDFDKNAISRIVYQFFQRGEHPTIEKVLEQVNKDSTLPNFRKSSFHKLLKNINIKFEGRERNNSLNDNDESDSDCRS